MSVARHLAFHEGSRLTLTQAFSFFTDKLLRVTGAARAIMESTFTQFVDRLHECAAKGEVDMVNKLSEGVGNVNAKNNQGWTALMFAARNNQAQVVKALLDRRCDISSVSNGGQTALDIAKFWNHTEVVRLLDPALEPAPTGTGIVSRLPQVINYFCNNPMDRVAHRRKDEQWLQERREHEQTRYILFHNLEPVVSKKGENQSTLGKGRFALCLFSYNDIKGILNEGDPAVVLLGLDTRGPHPGNKHPASQEDWPAVFAVDASHVTEEQIEAIQPGAFAVSVLPGMMQLDKYEGGILAQARTMLAWHDRYQFCPTCGSKTNLAEAGYKRACSNDDCRSQKGVHNTSYPRLDPTVIMAVVSPDGNQILLGRGAHFPKGMWSCLAGFLEPGESIEDACRREVEEETGIKVGRVDYHSCQPWPMPASLMIGCLAHASSLNVKVDREEIEEARWFTRHDAVALLNRQHKDGLFCPPEQAIAHQLIKAWVNMSSNL